MKTALIAALMVLILADPASAGLSVLGGLTREATLDPGENHEGTIELFNNSEETVQVTIFQTDYLFYADGSTRYDEPSTITRSNAGWISFSPSRMTIPAGETVSIYYDIAVPHDSKLDGTYWSIIMIEPAVGGAPPVIEQEDGKIVLGVRTVIRYAVQMITNIAGTGESNIRLSSNEIVNIDGKRMLRAEIENIGDRWLRPAVWLELYDRNGRSVGRFKSENKRIFPQCSVSHHLDLSEVPDGDYTGLFIVDNGDDRVFGASYEVRLNR